jgi:hypothetical protein
VRREVSRSLLEPYKRQPRVEIYRTLVDGVDENRLV